MRCRTHAAEGARRERRVVGGQLPQVDDVRLLHLLRHAVEEGDDVVHLCRRVHLEQALPAAGAC